MYEAKCIVMDYQHHNAQLQAQTQQHLQQLQSLAPDSTRWNQYQQFWRHQMLMNGIKCYIRTIIMYYVTRFLQLLDGCFVLNSQCLCYTVYLPMYNKQRSNIYGLNSVFSVSPFYIYIGTLFIIIVINNVPMHNNIIFLMLYLIVEIFNIKNYYLSIFYKKKQQVTDLMIIV